MVGTSQSAADAGVMYCARSHGAQRLVRVSHQQGDRFRRVYSTEPPPKATTPSHAVFTCAAPLPRNIGDARLARADTARPSSPRLSSPLRRQRSFPPDGEAVDHHKQMATPRACASPPQAPSAPKSAQRDRRYAERFHPLQIFSAECLK
ncbi:hypothetical protein KCP74_12925 [Salmonella enterica subsp. enterica]|nr:hypothetical protein KCP74_12925 [Salmonella enterica subsp. enterica]